MQQSRQQMNQYCSIEQSLKLICIFESRVGLKIINPHTNKTQVFQFQNKSIIMDWNNFLQEEVNGNKKIYSFCIENEDQKFSIQGEQELLNGIYNFCAGKFIYKKGTQIQTLQKIMETDDFKLNLIYDQHLKKEYEEKIIISQEQQNLDGSFDSQFTYCFERSIPEEILIIQDLQLVRIPQILQVQALYFDGVSYSYIYSKKDLINLTQYYDYSNNHNQCFVVHVAQQLMFLLIALEEKGIVHPGIQLKNLYTNPITQEIILVSYQQAYYYNLHEDRRIFNLGYTAPESFSKTTKITTQSNTYLVGVLLFHLIFGALPFGKCNQEILNNMLSGKQNFNLLDSLDPNLNDFLRKLFEKDQKKRLAPKQLLQHKIFSLSCRENFSKKSVQITIPIQDIQEFSCFNIDSNIQRVRQIPMFLKK